MIETQLNELIQAVENISLETDSDVSLSTEDYNLISWLGESLDSIANSLKQIEAKMK
jgi:hypothetical protein